MSSNKITGMGPNVTSNVTVLPSRGRVDPSGTQTVMPREGGGTGGTGARGRGSPQQQVINLDGKSLNRTAPRGTYLNIVV